MKYLKVAMILMVITLFSTSLFAQDSFVRSAVIDLPALEVGGVGNIISGVDFDGDGKLEIYAVNNNWSDAADEVIPRIYKYENNNGSWDSVWSATLADPIAQNTWPTIAWDDLDADGKSEIYWGPINNFVTGNEDPARVVVFEALGDGSDNMGVSDGSGGWLPNASWNLDLAPSTNMRPFKWVIEDIDNDGTKEIVFSDRAPFFHLGVFSVDNIPDNGDGSETWTLEFSGDMASPGIVRTGTIAAPANEPGGWGNIVAGVDFDGDGKKEIYAINHNWADSPDELTPRIYKYEWNGAYWEEVWMTELAIEAQNTWPALDYGDWDGDGKMEIIWGPVNFTSATNPNPARIVVFESAGDGSDVMGVDDGMGMYMPNAEWPIVDTDDENERPFKWELADIDSDGTMELCFGTRAGNLRYGIVSVDDIPDNADGSETWTLESSALDVGITVGAGTIYDNVVIDNTFYLIHSDGAVTPIAYEGGAYVSKPVQADAMPGGSWKSASVVDLDSNGVKEIVAGEWLGNGYNIFLLQQDADTLTKTIIGDFSALGATRINAGDAGDIDGNGLIDFVFGSRTGFSTTNNDVYRLEYLGGDITDPANYTESIIDSKLDEVGGQLDIILFANIDDDPAEEVVYSGTPRSTTALPIAVLDYNDGTFGGGAKYDLAVIDNMAYLFASNGNVYPAKYENDRWQVLGELTDVVPTSGSWKSSSVADIDGDGTEEILIGEWSGAQSVRLLQPMNGGLKSTVVVDLSGEALPPRLNGGAMGDIDQDGFMDFIFGTRDSDGGIYRVEYTGGAIDDPMNYSNARIDELIVPGANQMDVITIANVDADPELEIIYSGTPRTTYPTPIPIAVLDIITVETTDIGVARADDDGNTIPDLLGQEVTIRGVVTTDNFQANSDDLGIYVQDATGGIFLFANNDDSTEVAVGDLIQVTGTITQFNGLTEIEVENSGENIIKQGTGTVPTPVEILASDFYNQPDDYAEMFEGQLVKFKYVAKKDGTWPDSTSGSTNLTFWDGTEGSEFTFRIDSDMDLRNNPEPTYPVNLVGVMGQFDSSDPYDSGYQGLGTFYADIEQDVVAPPSALFRLLTPGDGAVITIDDPAAEYVISWESSADLNGDALIYQWVPIGGTPVFTNNDTTLTLDGATILSLMGSNTTLELMWTVETSDLINPAVGSVDTFMVTFNTVGQEALATLDHATTNLGLTVYNDGQIGDHDDLGGNGLTWKGANGLWRGGTLWGTQAAGYANGSANVNTAEIQDLVNVMSNFAGGFSSETMGTVTFDQVSKFVISDSAADNPYGLDVVVKTYSKSDEDVVFYRYGVVNNSGAEVQNLYYGMFVDFDVDGNNYASNSGGYELSENLVYQYYPAGGAATPYYGIAALSGLDGYKTTDADPASTIRTSLFEYISTPDGDPIGADGDFRSWAGTLIPSIADGDTGYVTFALVAGDDLSQITQNAANAAAIAIDAGFLGTTGINDKAIIPDVFFVDQNYPNPFNPSTTIKFGLPTEASVDLRIYDILGQQVAVIYNNQVLSAGTYEHMFDASKLASGTYIYRLQSNENVVTKKMMLLK
jgi:hypothetical protein